MVVSELGTPTGHLTRVNGPLVEIRGLAAVAMFEVVRVGKAGLAAEVVSIGDGAASAQVYEYTGGLRVGDPAVGTGQPLVARLGPGTSAQRETVCSEAWAEGPTGSRPARWLTWRSAPRRPRRQTGWRLGP